jgi:hypothetical protein
MLILIPTAVCLSATVSYWSPKYCQLVQITNKMHQVSKILFCHETLHVSYIYSAHHQELSGAHVEIGMFHAGYVAAALESQVGTAFNYIYYIIYQLYINYI